MQKAKVGAPLWGERDENQYKVYNYIYQHIADVKHQIKTWKIQQISLNLRNELPLRRCCDPSKINATMNCCLKKKNEEKQFEYFVSFIPFMVYREVKNAHFD